MRITNILSQLYFCLLTICCSLRKKDMIKSQAKSDTTLLRHTLNRLGHSFEDIDTVLKDHKGPVNFQIVKDKLHELKNRKKYELILSEDEMKPYTSSAMIVISSESDSSDEEVNSVLPKTSLSKQNPRNQQQHRVKTYKNDLASKKTYSDMDIAENTLEPNPSRNYRPAMIQTHLEQNDSDIDDNYALYDMPDRDKLQRWFEKNYRYKYDGVVLKEDLFAHFCKDFKTPSYPELQQLFFEKIRILLLNGRYGLVQCVEDNFFDGLEAVEIQVSSSEKAANKLKAVEIQSTVKEHKKVEIEAASMVKVTDQLQNLLKKPNVVPSNKQESSKTSPSHRQTFDKARTVDKTAIQKEIVLVPDRREISKAKSSKLSKTVSSDNQNPTSSTKISVSEQIRSLCNGPKAKTAPKKETVSPSLPAEIVNTNGEQKNKTSGHSSKDNQPDPVRRNERAPVTKVDARFLSNKQLLDLPDTEGDFNLRPIVIDGSNVACSHGNGSYFSCRGIALCVHYFWLRGHHDIICFVPHFRKAALRGNPPTKDRDILFELEDKNICKFTPSRKVDGKMLISYDDRFILDLAKQNNGVVVSNDQYRDLIDEDQGYKEVIATSLLPYVFAQDYFMPAKDPLGRNGPNLDDFLSFSQRETKKKVTEAVHSNTSNQSEFGARAGYGMYNTVRSDLNRNATADRPKHSTITPANERLSEKYNLRAKVANPGSSAISRQRFRETGKTQKEEPSLHTKNAKTANPLIKHKDKPSIEEQLKSLFPDSEDKINSLIARYSYIDDVNWFANFLLMTSDGDT